MEIQILDELGLRISGRKDDRVTLIGGETWNKLGDQPKELADALRAVARALGGPAAHDLGAPPGDNERADRFLLFAMPRLVAGSDAALVFDALTEAHAAKARVRFRYRDPYRVEATRVVDPPRSRPRRGFTISSATTRSRAKGWRHFAIDRIVTPPTRAGSFTPHAVPPA